MGVREGDGENIGTYLKMTPSRDIMIRWLKSGLSHENPGSKAEPGIRVKTRENPGKTREVGRSEYEESVCLSILIINGTYRSSC